MAMPPDDLPAGSCPSCGKTYCIGCAKENLDPQGRFVCPACGKSLKLINEGLKKLVADWAESAL
jgi:transposase-like protein